MSKEQFAAVAPTKIAEREADRAALYERTAERLNAQLEAYPALSPDHDYLKAKRISPEPGVFETPREAAWRFRPLTRTASSGVCSTLTRTAQSDSHVNRGKRVAFTWWDQPIQWVIWTT